MGYFLAGFVRLCQKAETCAPNSPEKILTSYKTLRALIWVLEQTPRLKQLRCKSLSSNGEESIELWRLFVSPEKAAKHPSADMVFVQFTGAGFTE